MSVAAAGGVLESAVFGLPHPDFGEAVTAVIVRAEAAAQQPTQAEVIAALRQRLAAYKLPKRVLWVDELPRNSMGKVQKKLLRERYASLNPFDLNDELEEKLKHILHPKTT